MVPFALGTQTLGSVLRPASYCGVCGFKPSFGLLSTEGVLPFAKGRWQFKTSQHYGNCADLHYKP